MKNKTDKNQDRIGEHLGRYMKKVKRSGLSGWTGVITNGQATTVQVHAADGWLCLEAELKDKFFPGSSGEAFELLRHNSGLPGLAKFALDSESRLACLCAELPVLEEIDLGTRIGETIEGFRGGMKRLRGREEQEDAAATGSTLARAACPEAGGDLRALCRDAGWPFVIRTDEKVAVELEVRGRFHQAMLERAAGGGVRMWAELARYDLGCDVCREAIAVFLLGLGRFVRMVRPAANGENGQTSLGFEATFGTFPCPAEVVEALSALSVACALCGEEVVVLTDQRISQRFLALRGWSAQEILVSSSC